MQGGWAALRYHQQESGEEGDVGCGDRRAVSATAVACGVVAGACIVTAQLNTPPWLLLVGLMIPTLLTPLFHLADRRTLGSGGGGTLSRWLGPLASYHIYSVLLTAILLNAAWALRWLAGADYVLTRVYGVSEDDTASLTQCGVVNPWMTLKRSCPMVLSGFLAHPIGLYVHAPSSALALALGPLQLWKRFRVDHLKVHRFVGYAYSLAVLLGCVGSAFLIARTTSGASVGIGFGILAALWIATLWVAVRHARNKSVSEHRRWMTRNYFLTFAAVPFRFIPAILTAFAVEQALAYDIGAWLTLALALISAEVYLRQVQQDSNA